MELAGMQAVCDFYNIELYDFLVTGDIVDQLEYTSEGLHDANHNLDKFYVALKIAEMIYLLIGYLQVVERWCLLI